MLKSVLIPTYDTPTKICEDPKRVDTWTQRVLVYGRSPKSILALTSSSTFVYHLGGGSYLQDDKEYSHDNSRGVTVTPSNTRDTMELRDSSMCTYDMNFRFGWA